MKQLQVHEYLELLDEGVQSEEASKAVTESAMRVAKSLWSDLRIAVWNAHPRQVELVSRCQESGRQLVHVSADWKNCFLILVFPSQTTDPESFILFDIGAEYNEPLITCPAFGMEDEPVTEHLIEERIPALQQVKENSFAILQTGDGTYIQLYADGPDYWVEHQLVSLCSHYQLESPVDAETATRLFKSYAFGRKEWAREFTWAKMVL